MVFIPKPYGFRTKTVSFGMKTIRFWYENHNENHTRER